MESGGKAVTKRYRKKITVVISLVLPVILLFAILNCFTTYVFYEDYKYKMNLMTEIAAKEEFSGLDAVSELLKDKDIETNEQGRRLLEQYGYWGNKGNAFYMQFRHQVMVTGAVSTVICVLLLTFLLYWKKKEDACHQKILDQLEEILIRFRENKFDALLKTENPAELEKLNDQLEAIGHHIQLLKEEAREEKESTKEMVSDISHQLKTPVAALDTCFSVLMQNDLSATEQEEFRIRCRSALDGLETLLQSLLEISKMETGLIQINKKKLPLMDTVISAVNCTYPKADEKEIEFVFDYAKELETCMVMQDKRWLGEAVINVLDNAIKYSPDGSRLDIHGERIYYMPEGLPDVRGIRFLRTGLLLGELKKNRFEPSQAFAMCLKKDEYAQIIDLPCEDERVRRYLKGETLDVDDLTERKAKGWYLVCVDGFPLGWGKVSNGTLKNKYLPGWRLC